MNLLSVISKPLVKVFVVGQDGGVVAMFDRDKDYITTMNPDNADLICFTGGEDVSPDLYGEEKHNYTHCNSVRDDREKAIFNKYLDVPKVGICRGGQFLNVMSGGAMWQDVTGHTLSHVAYSFGYLRDKVKTPVDVFVTSTHHQMMRPSPDARIIAVANKATKLESFSNIYLRDMAVVDDVEVVHYPKTKSLCFQPHPEYQIISCREYFFALLDKFMANPSFKDSE